MSTVWCSIEMLSNSYKLNTINITKTLTIFIVAIFSSLEILLSCFNILSYVIMKFLKLIDNYYLTTQRGLI